MNKTVGNMNRKLINLEVLIENELTNRTEQIRL